MAPIQNGCVPPAIGAAAPSRCTRRTTISLPEPLRLCRVQRNRSGENGCGLEYVTFVARSSLENSDSHHGTAGLPLPIGERVGVRGFGPIDSLGPLTPPLSLREREPAAIVAQPCLHSTQWETEQSTP